MVTNQLKLYTNKPKHDIQPKKKLLTLIFLHICRGTGGHYILVKSEGDHNTFDLQ